MLARYHPQVVSVQNLTLQNKTWRPWAAWQQTAACRDPGWSHRTCCWDSTEGGWCDGGLENTTDMRFYTEQCGFRSDLGVTIIFQMFFWNCRNCILTKLWHDCVGYCMDIMTPGTSSSSEKRRHLPSLGFTKPLATPRVRAATASPFTTWSSVNSEDSVCMTRGRSRCRTCTRGQTREPFSTPHKRYLHENMLENIFQLHYIVVAPQTTVVYKQQPSQ